MTIVAADLPALSRLLDALLHLDAAEQARRLHALTGDDARLAAPLQAMLAQRRSTALLDAADTDDGLPHLLQLPQLPQAPVGLAGDLVGPYRLVQEIGRGGMGSVWLAQRADGMFDREVAVKLPTLPPSAQWAERLARERRIGALLEHRNIARLYDAGIDAQGRPYLVMERIRGQGFLAHGAAHCRGLPDRLALMLQVCAALAHAHQLLVIHRDIKPANLMVDGDGQVKLLDFGIARLFEPDGDGEGNGNDSRQAGADDGGQHTRTPGYAAPEQVAGDAISTRTDLYACGVVLHELLTGRRPALSAAGNYLPAGSLPADVDAVVARCLQRDPDARYSSADRLADDLQRLLAYRPVLARNAGAVHRGRLFLRRNGAVVVVSAAVALGSVGAGAVLFGQHQREQAQAQRALQAQAFLFDMLESAEQASSRPAREVTAFDMLRGALTRARSSFANQPVLRGQVLTELGLMLRRMNEPAEALAVLREAHALLETAAAPGDPALAIAQAQLASLLLTGADAAAAAQARPLAAAALAHCTDGSERCAKARAYAHDALLSWAVAHHDSAAALLHADAAVAANERGFGAAHVEVALALSKRAVQRRNRGELRAAFADIDRAMTIAATATLAAADRRDLRTRHALLQHDLGRDDNAVAELQALLAWDGMSAAARPLTLRLLAQAQSAQGLWPEAVATATRALAEAQAQADDWEAGFALQARAGAQSALGHVDAARRDIAATLDALQRQGLDGAGLEFLRARRIAAGIEARAGNDAAARAQLLALVPLHRSGANGRVLAPVDLAQTLDWLGQLARRDGSLQQAMAWHAEAEALLAQALPVEHPLRRRHAVLTALATWLATPPAQAQAEAQAQTQTQTQTQTQAQAQAQDAVQAPAALTTALDTYLAGLPQQSGWRAFMPPSSAPRAAWTAVLF